MSRVNWDGRGRVRRLSTFAVELLTHLCVPDACLRFDPKAGVFHLVIGEIKYQRIQQKNVEVLAGPRLVTRDRASELPVYRIAEHGRDLVLSRVRQRCADDGRECDSCPTLDCAFRSR